MTEIITTDRLLLTPLQVGDAVEMAGVLAARELYEFTCGEPPDAERLAARYRAQIAGPSRAAESWHNWIVRLAASGAALGYVQATITGDEADVAWVIGVGAQGKGFAGEAAAAMCAWLARNGVGRITAHIHPQHRASAAIAKTCGLQPTNETDDDGEVVWESAHR